MYCIASLHKTSINNSVSCFSLTLTGYWAHNHFFIYSSQPAQEINWFLSKKQRRQQSKQQKQHQHNNTSNLQWLILRTAVGTRVCTYCFWKHWKVF